MEILRKQTHFQEDFSAHTDKNQESIKTALRNITRLTRQQDSDLRIYIEHNMEELNKSKGTIIRVHSTGDTPSKGNFKLSPSIDRRLSINTVFKQINQNSFSNKNVESDNGNNGK